MRRSKIYYFIRPYTRNTNNRQTFFRVLSREYAMSFAASFLRWSVCCISNLRSLVINFRKQILSSGWLVLTRTLALNSQGTGRDIAGNMIVGVDRRTLRSINSKILQAGTEHDAYLIILKLMLNHKASPNLDASRIQLHSS